MFRRESLRTDMNDVDAKTDRIDIDIYRCIYIYISAGYSTRPHALTFHIYTLLHFSYSSQSISIRQGNRRAQVITRYYGCGSRGDRARRGTAQAPGKLRLQPEHLSSERYVAHRVPVAPRRHLARDRRDRALAVRRSRLHVQRDLSRGLV